MCYDTGRAYGGGFVTRRVFDPAMTRRELQIIRDDLHCNAVRFQGTDIGRLMAAATGALELGGLQVWLSPELFKKSRAATVAYLAQAAAAAETLNEQFPAGWSSAWATLAILDAEGADGAFIWTFADPWLTYSADPRRDLDMTSTALVKTCERGGGTTHPGLPWEPKPAFGAVASFYATH